jgi:hypothetical protein
MYTRLEKHSDHDFKEESLELHFEFSEYHDNASCGCYSVKTPKYKKFWEELIIYLPLI